MDHARMPIRTEAEEERDPRGAEIRQAELRAADEAKAAFAADQAREADRVLAEQIHHAARLGVESLAKATDLAPREIQARWLVWAWRERRDGTRTDAELRLYAQDLDPSGDVLREYIGGATCYGPQDPPPPAWHRIDRAIY